MNRVFEGKHWAVLAMLFTSVGAQGFGLKDWSEATSPSFVFGLAGTIGAGLMGLFVRAPEKKND